tara:strand:+ start:700 stop:1125 length:426 start_codon:yes stop_codon:yes gene_type:complete
MKLEISVNFDFGKLAGKAKNIIDDYTSGYAQDSVKGTRRNIDSGVGADGKKLELGAGSYRYGQQALYNTGEMYNTLKSNKNTLTIKKYGYKHDRGMYKVRQGTNVKKFIGTTKENKQKLDKKFMQDIQKALRSNKKVVSLG